MREYLFILVVSHNINALKSCHNFYGTPCRITPSRRKVSEAEERKKERRRRKKERKNAVNSGQLVS